MHIRTCWRQKGLTMCIALHAGRIQVLQQLQGICLLEGLAQADMFAATAPGPG